MMKEAGILVTSPHAEPPRFSAASEEGRSRTPQPPAPPEPEFQGPAGMPVADEGNVRASVQGVHQDAGYIDVRGMWKVPTTLVDRGRRYSRTAGQPHCRPAALQASPARCS